MFFDSWISVFKIIMMALLIYPAVILLLRISGKRTLSKMNMFDLVITVAIGSTVATILLSSQVKWLDGIAALSSLIFLQYAVTWLEVRSKTFTSFVKGEPQLLMYQGEMVGTAMKKERVKADEIRQAIRSQGVYSLGRVKAVVLETDGSFSVITKETDPGDSSLKDVDGMQAPKK
ncbi:DUF421 domain-containing protein [Halobacillus litoralis]|uniref:DUF421 domain-containing protein n=1 Tax=Halobacillus litoralis TaxID=45668 RepID=UPI002490D988|nr:YetF domain-containing protein [Halobacillus litoralis]